MKNVTFLLIAAMFFVACSKPSSKDNQEQKESTVADVIKKQKEDSLLRLAQDKREDSLEVLSQKHDSLNALFQKEFFNQKGLKLNKREDAYIKYVWDGDTAHVPAKIIYGTTANYKFRIKSWWVKYENVHNKSGLYRRLKHNERNFAVEFTERNSKNSCDEWIQAYVYDGDTWNKYVSKTGIRFPKQCEDLGEHYCNGYYKIDAIHFG